MVNLEPEDHLRDIAFSKAMHGKTADGKYGFAAALNKDFRAQKTAVEEYFKHWDGKLADVETEEDRAVRGPIWSFCWRDAVANVW